MNKPLPFIAQRFQNIYRFSVTSINQCYYCADNLDMNYTMRYENPIEITRDVNQVYLYIASLVYHDELKRSSEI